MYPSITKIISQSQLICLDFSHTSLVTVPLLNRAIIHNPWFYNHTKDRRSQKIDHAYATAIRETLFITNEIPMNRYCGPPLGALIPRARAFTMSF